MTSGSIGQSGIKRAVKACAAIALAAFVGVVQANPLKDQLNLPPGVTSASHEAYSLNNICLGVCVVIGTLVFGAMFIAMFRFRKSRGAVAEKWSHNTMVEVIWTTIPVIILATLAYLSTGGIVREADTTGSQMTIKITGYQWKWRYDYLSYQGKPISHVGFMSKLDDLSNKTRQLDSGMNPYDVKVDGENTYLLNVDKPLVVPIDTKIRFLITGGDVIHSWWVPDLGWKKDAIPGFINPAWVNIEKPGTYRGQCAQLCGQDHGYMPIVVIAKTKADFAKWLTAQETSSAAPAAAPATPAAPAAPAAASSAAAAPQTAKLAPTPVVVATQG